MGMEGWANAPAGGRKASHQAQLQLGHLRKWGQGRSGLPEG